MRMLLLVPLLALFAGPADAQAVPSLESIKSQAELDKAIASLDAALFDSYNRCDVEKFASFGTKIVFDHTGLPKGAAEHLAAGWKEHYWAPLERFLA